MPRLNFTISKRMDSVLQSYSDETGVPIATHVRSLIVEWAKRQGIDLQDDVAWGGARKHRRKTQAEEKSGELAATRAN